ncbi:MAG: ASKHA domain-containing protein [Coriobacteriia bacterium]|nr:ASKHA domain-containing protein [Coriobacteriia bacterium]
MDGRDMVEDCVFCKMVAGEIPVTPVYEDDTVLAFDDIAPQAPVHTLVVPKQHVANLAEGEQAGVLGGLFSAATKVAEMKGVAESGYRTIVNSGEDARQTVQHLHVHIMGGSLMDHGMVAFADEQDAEDAAPENNRADRVKVVFEPSKATVWVEEGTLLLDAASKAGVTIVAACGGCVTCGACAVRVEDGTLDEPGKLESRELADSPDDVRLACRARVVRPVTVRPLLDVDADRGDVEPGAAAAAIIMVGSDASPIEAELGFRLKPLVAVVDLGTTTVTAAVAEIGSEGMVGLSTVGNRQQSRGADVLSRVSEALGGWASELRDEAVASVRIALQHALERALPDGDGLETQQLKRLVIAGNPVMSSLICGESVASLAEHPFSAPEYPINSKDLSDRLSLPFCRVEVLPPIAGFVGGDVLAGLVHTGMLDASGPELLIDLGTNAEIALIHEGRLWVASAASGPAFEATGIGCGVPALPGAIIAASMVDDALVVETVGTGESPMGIAGSGLISIIALLSRLGHVDAAGVLSPEGPLSELFLEGEDGGTLRRLVIAEAPAAEGAGAGAGQITLSQLDVRAFQLAKAAIAAGVCSVLDAAEVAATELKAVHVTGALGMALDARDLADTGFFPSAVEPVMRAVDNAALLGALALAQQKPEVLAAVTEAARKATYVDLAMDSEFNRRLLAALAIKPYDA